MESPLRTHFTTPLALLSCLAFVGIAQAEILYSENFERLPLGPEWSLANPGTGRARVTTEFEPLEGKQHLVLDDSANDAVSTPAQAILRVDLNHRRNLILQFRVRSLGNEPDWAFGQNSNGMPTFDGISVSTDQGATWTVISSLIATGNDTTTSRVNLDGYLFQFRPRTMPEVLIRFSEFDNASAPIDGLAIDAIEITGEPAQRLQIELPASVREGSSPQTGFVMIAYPSDGPTQIALSTPSTEDVVMPAFVTIAPGQTYAPFEFTVRDDTLVNLTRGAEVEGSIPGVTTAFAFLDVQDNEPLAIRLEMPATLVEGSAEPSQGRIVLDRPADVPVTINLNQDPYNQIEAPYSLTVPVGTTELAFPARAQDDNFIEGPMLVSVKAEVPGVPSSAVRVRVEDNERRTIQLSLDTPFHEGTNGWLTLRLPGVLTEPLTIDLTNLTPELATVPQTVEYSAYRDMVKIAVKPFNNTIRDGSRIARITASAASFEPSTLSFTIFDDELAALRIVRTPDLVEPGGSGMNIEVTALDIEGRPITARNFRATLEFIGMDGTAIPASPGSIQIVDGVWFGQLNLPESSKAPLQLRITGPDSVEAKTTPIETLRILPYKAGDLVWDARRQRLYASLRSTGNGDEANQVVALDPTTGEILARVPVASDPMSLAMTSGGDFLYAALDGSAKIARIDLETFTEESTFRVGSSPTFGLLYAGDMQTVENQPNRLIVCRVRKGFFNSAAGVVVFDNGEPQPTDAQLSTEIDRIEPSADPSKFFGYITDSSRSNFRVLKLTETGLTEESISQFPTEGCCTDLRSDGDRVFGSNGTIFDGRAKVMLGRFSASGEVCPDRAINRVYFIEQASIFGQSRRLAAMDATTHARIGQLTLPPILSEAASLVRWGKTGLAFRTADAIAILRAGSLIPSEPPADLQMNVSASEPELTPGQPIVYTIEVSNLGPNPVAGAAINARFTNLQSIQRVEASEGIAIQSEDSINLSSLSINAGGRVTFKVTALPKELGSITCVARVHSTAVDPVPENDSKVVSISVGYRTTPNSVHVIPISGLDIVQDPADGALLVSGVTSLSGDESTARSVIRVNPINGRISHSIALSAQPSMLALSSSGRYLYAGLDDLPAIERIDMRLGLPDLRIPLGVDQFGDLMYAEDIEVITGDGTSFITSLMQQQNHRGVAVFDGVTRRPKEVQSFQGSNLIEPTSQPNLFVGLGTRSFNDNVQTLLVDETGVRETRVVENLAAGSSPGFASDGDLMLTGGGNLFDGPSLSLKVHLTTGGQPLVDAANGRVYMLSGNIIYAYDSTEFTEIARFELGTETPQFNARRFIRWGLDGFAILDQRQRLILVRWSEAIAPDRDQDRDGLADRWEAQHFGTLAAIPEADPDGDGLSNRTEYELGTSPTQANAEVAPRILGLQTAPAEMVLRYERVRLAGHPRFDVQQSPDLANWTSINDGAETVESVETRNETTRETVRWAHPPSTNAPSFFRVRWLP